MMKTTLTCLSLALCLATSAQAASKKPAKPATDTSAAPAPQRPLLPVDRPMGIAAVVNDDIITSQDVEDRALILMALTGGGETPEGRAHLITKSLGMLIDETLEMQEAGRNSVSVGDAEIDAAITTMEKARGRQQGSLLAFIRAAGLSENSLKNQFRAELAWHKTVVKKLRSNIAVTDAEIARAQQTALNPRMITQAQISALSIPVTSPEGEAKAAATAKALSDEIEAGKSFDTVAREIASRPDVRIVPALWLSQNQLEPQVGQAIKALDKGETSKPLRSLNTYQIVHVLDRRQVAPPNPETEVALKQMQLTLNDNAPNKEVDAMVDIAKAVQTNPGSCGEKGIAGIESFEGLNINVNYMRTTFKDMSPEMSSLVIPLNVGDTTAPYATRGGLELLMLCEKIEPPLKPPNREEIRTQLIGERAELEAEKMLRNLKRDAFIDIKTGKMQ